MTVDSTMTAVQEVPVDAMEEAEVHREEVRWRWSVDNFGSDHGFWRGNRVIGLAELTGIPLENWSTGIILFVMFLLFLLFGVIILLFY